VDVEEVGDVDQVTRLWMLMKYIVCLMIAVSWDL
jgi:hypothetical protein